MPSLSTSADGSMEPAVTPGSIAALNKALVERSVAPVSTLNVPTDEVQPRLLFFGNVTDTIRL
jgi:hypothetical protein